MFSVNSRVFLAADGWLPSPELVTSLCLSFGFRGVLEGVSSVSSTSPSWAQHSHAIRLKQSPANTALHLWNTAAFVLTPLSKAPSQHTQYITDSTNVDHATTYRDAHRQLLSSRKRQYTRMWTSANCSGNIWLTCGQPEVRSVSDRIYDREYLIFSDFDCSVRIVLHIESDTVNGVLLIHPIIKLDKLQRGLLSEQTITILNAIFTDTRFFGNSKQETVIN